MKNFKCKIKNKYIFTKSINFRKLNIFCNEKNQIHLVLFYYFRVLHIFKNTSKILKFTIDNLFPKNIKYI